MGPWYKARHGVPQLPSLFGYSPPNGAAIPPHPPYRARLTTTLARRSSLRSETQPMERGRPRPPPGESQASVTTLPPWKNRGRPRAVMSATGTGIGWDRSWNHAEGSVMRRAPLPRQSGAQPPHSKTPSTQILECGGGGRQPAATAFKKGDTVCAPAFSALPPSRLHRSTAKEAETTAGTMPS